MNLQLAAATEDLHSDLKRGIGLAHSLKVDGVRLNTRSDIDVRSISQTGLRQTLLFVKERQMRVAGLYCPTRHALYDEDYLEPRLEVIRRSMDVARQLETSELLIRCGRLPDADDDVQPVNKVNADDAGNPFFLSGQPSAPSPAKKYSLLVELLNDLAEHGNHVGCVPTLVLSDYNSERLAALRAAVTKGPLQYCFDPATCVMTGVDSVEAFRALYADIGYVRARDALKDVDGAGVETAVGRGNVDWIQVLPTLLEADYTGWVCVERVGGDDRYSDVAAGVEYLRSLLPANE